jgi:hypothetical protein
MKPTLLARCIRAAIANPPTPDGTTYDVFCVVALWSYAGILPKA